MHPHIISKVATYLGHGVDKIFRTCRSYHDIRHDTRALCDWAMRACDPVVRLYCSPFFVENMSQSLQKQCIEYIISCSNKPPTKEGLREAIIHNHADIVNVLIAHGATIENGASVAAMCGHVDLVKYFLGKGDNVFKAIAEAVKHGELPVIQLLVEDYHIYPDSVANMAIIFDHVSVVRYITDNFTIHTAPDLLREAVQLNKCAIVHHLVKIAPITVELVRLAAMYGHHLILEEMFKHESYKTFAYDLEALRLTIAMSHMHAANVLLNHGANPNHAMTMAMESGAADIVHAISHRIEISHALTSAISSNRPEYVQSFLCQGADPYDGLLLAVICDSVDIVRLLLSYGACKDKAIRMAAQFGTAEMVMYLAKHEHANLKDGVHGAIHGGRADIVKMLANFGANLHDGDIMKWVVRYGNNEVIELFQKN